MALNAISSLVFGSTPKANGVQVTEKAAQDPLDDAKQPPKKRGRPKKEGSDAKEVPLKDPKQPPKKRGRPKKDGSAEDEVERDANDDEEEEEEPTKKDRKVTTKKASAEGAEDSEDWDRDTSDEEEEWEEDAEEWNEQKKPAKKIIPKWASVSEKKASKSKASKKAKKVTALGIIIESVKKCSDGKGLAPYLDIKKHVMNHDSWHATVFKESLYHAMKNNCVEIVKKRYTLVPGAHVKEAKVTKKEYKKKESKKDSKKKESKKSKSVNQFQGLNLKDLQIGIIIEAMKECGGKRKKSLVTGYRIKKYVEEHPSWPLLVFKQTLSRAVEIRCVKQDKKTYKFLSEQPVDEKTKVKKSKNSKAKKVYNKECNLDELFPHIFTWVAEPKEATYDLIENYLEKHFPNLDAEGPLKKAVDAMVTNGQLNQIALKQNAGKNSVRTFQLEGDAQKSGSEYEDAIEDAIVASSEPKAASLLALRDYIIEYHPEYNLKGRGFVLRRALERAEAKGWIERVDGSGFSGTFRIAYPYIPSPKDLWRGDYKPDDDDERRAYKDMSSDEEGSDDSEGDSDSSDSDESEVESGESDSDESSDESEEEIEYQEFEPEEEVQEGEEVVEGVEGEEEGEDMEGDSGDYDSSDSEIMPEQKKRGAPESMEELVSRKKKKKSADAKTKEKKKSRQ